MGWKLVLNPTAHDPCMDDRRAKNTNGPKRIRSVTPMQKVKVGFSCAPSNLRS